jgi:hypothetical protein
VKYVCTEDIENLAAQGRKELILDENTVLMDLARDLARQLGIAIVDGAHPIPAKAASPAAAPSPAKAVSPAAPATSSNGKPPSLGAKPKGCQHGPLTVVPHRSHANSHQNSDGMVDQLVELVKQSVGKRPGN